MVLIVQLYFEDYFQISPGKYDYCAEVGDSNCAYYPGGAIKQQIFGNSYHCILKFSGKNASLEAKFDQATGSAL